MAVVEIQGIQVHYRDLKDGETVLFSDLPKEEQYYRRPQHPFTDSDLIAIANKEHNYTSIQLKWKETQEEIFENGIYASINGDVTFIPGAYYCYVNEWTLEHGEKPEYREDDRQFFLLHEYLRLETNVLGLVRLKGRRQGATSIAMFFMWFIAGRKEHKLCGLTSFSDTAAQDAFQKMFMYGFKAMLPCFQADFDSASENFIRFVKPIDKKAKSVLAVKREGLNSYCDYKSNVISSYDSGRQSYNVPDEGGKRNKLNINSYWSRLYKTLLIGVNKVGFAYLPTTVGMKTEGGENFKEFYKNANQFEIDKKTGNPVGLDTTNRVVRYFVPATHCYAGYIDKFGKSIVEDPIEPVLTNEGKLVSIGSKSVILKERERLSGEQLMEHRRDYPLTEHDAFSFELGQCEFNEERLLAQIQELEDNPVFLRKCRLYRVKVTKKNIFTDREESHDEIKFMDDDKGEWLLYEPPNKQNHYDWKGAMMPLNDLMYSIGVDTKKTGFAVGGSTATICVFKKSHLVDGEEMGLKPVAIYMGKPRLLNHFFENVLMACMWYGCKANFEIDAGSAYYDYFLEHDARLFISWTPRRAIDITKKNPVIKPGTESASPFQLQAQLETAKLYVDGNLIDGYNGNVHRIVYPMLLEQLLAYQHAERTPYDIVISLMMALLPCFGVAEYRDEKIAKPKQILPYKKIKMPA